MGTTVCEACGATNPADASFCQVCHAFVGWDRTTVLPQVAPPEERAEEHIETRVLPKITDHRAPTAAPEGQTTPVLAVRVEQREVTVPLTGARAELPVIITNRSDIVDGYEVDAGGAPDWLVIDSRPIRLLPGGEDRLVLGFRLESDSLIPAGRGTLRLRVRSLTQPPAHEIVEIALIVPVLDAPVQVRTEPSVVRVTDADVGRFVVVVDNSHANQPAEVRLSGSDPELAVEFHFDPAVVTVGPGESVRVRAVASAARPQPGGELTRTLTVSASAGRRRADAVVTFRQATSAVVEDPMVEVVAVPALLRIRDGEVATARLRIDNRAGRRRADVRLSASDPEQVVVAQWTTTEVWVPAGEVTEVEVRLSSPLPEPGTEVTHPVTLAVTDGLRAARAQLTVVHSASASPMTTLGVQLDPSVLRLGSGRRGSSTVVVDNRGGRQPVRVRLLGDDPENVIAFAFNPAELTIGPGQAQASRVVVSTRRAPTGPQLTRPFTVAASDGRTSVSTTGSLLQEVGDRRPWARLVLTLLGGLLMIVGTMLPLRAASGRSPFGVSVDTVAGLFGANVDLGAFDQLITFGLVIMVVAGLMVFGLTGRSGRLTRWMAVLAALLTVALMITIASVGIDATPGSGTVLIILGCVLGYIGGLLARR